LLYGMSILWNRLPGRFSSVLHSFSLPATAKNACSAMLPVTTLFAVVVPSVCYSILPRTLPRVREVLRCITARSAVPVTVVLRTPYARCGADDHPPAVSPQLHDLQPCLPFKRPLPVPVSRVTVHVCLTCMAYWFIRCWDGLAADCQLLFRQTLCAVSLWTTPSLACLPAVILLPSA